jgi:hypothetical protein
MRGHENRAKLFKILAGLWDAICDALQTCVWVYAFVASTVGEDVPTIQDCSTTTRQPINVDCRPVIEDQASWINHCFVKSHIRDIIVWISD